MPQAREQQELYATSTFSGKKEEGVIIFREKHVEEETEAACSVIVFEFSPLVTGHKIYTMICEVDNTKEGDEEENRLIYSKSFVCCNRSQAQRMGVYQMDHLNSAYQIKNIFGKTPEFNYFPSSVRNQL